MTKVLQLSGLLLQGLLDLVGRALLKGHLDEKTFLFVCHAVVDILQEFLTHECFGSGGDVHVRCCG